MPTEELNVLALLKPNGERYIFIFDNASRAEMFRVLGRYATNPDLSFTWYEAVVLSHRVSTLIPK